MVIPEQIENAMGQLLTSIRESDVYQRYKKSREEILAHPEYLEQINEFRRQTYAFTSREEPLTGFTAETRQLLRYREKIRQNNIMAEFLDSEMEMCVLMRTLTLELANTTDFLLEDSGIEI